MDTAGHWAEDNIVKLKDEGIIQGYPDGTFRPENSLKRVEFAAFLLRTLGYQEVADIDPFFADVPGSYWGFGTIQGLVLKHIVARDTNFYPEDNITRLEIILWEVRALGLEDQTVNRTHSGAAVLRPVRLDRTGTKICGHRVRAAVDRRLPGRFAQSVGICHPGGSDRAAVPADGEFAVNDWILVRESPLGFGQEGFLLHIGRSIAALEKR